MSMNVNVRTLCRPCKIPIHAMVRVPLFESLHEFVLRLKILKNYHLLFHPFFVSFLMVFLEKKKSERKTQLLGAVCVKSDDFLGEKKQKE
jgi:hypothetical protein